MIRVLAVGLLVALPVCADELGRLFSTAQQRAALDRGNEPSNHAAIHIQGMVTRGGQTVVWVNDRPLATGESRDGASLLHAGEESATLLLPGEREPITLKAGQGWRGGRIVEGQSAVGSGGSEP